MNAGVYSTIKGMSPQFLVTDINRAIEFYTNKLGFEVNFRYGDFYSGIIKDGYSIHLKLATPAIEERQIAGDGGTCVEVDRPFVDDD